MQNKLFNSSQNKFWMKPIIIFILLLILLIPLGFIKSIVNDRSVVKRDAQMSITSPVGGNLKIDGILLSIPFKKRVETINNMGLAQMIETTDQILITPQNLKLQTTLNPTQLKRGIFSVPIFNGDIAVYTQFNELNIKHLGVNERDILFDEATLILGVGNKKSLTAFPSFKIGEHELTQSLATPKYSPFAHNIYYNLPKEFIKQGFEIIGNIAVQGGEKLMLTPMAKNNNFIVKSTWNSPSFSGGWLPKTREVSQQGFEANWEISGLSTNFPPVWIADEKRDFYYDSVIAEFIEPVSNYSLIYRCVNYAILFLAVPFLAIFICEIYTDTRIHPIQYLLIGITDVIFYLLALSFSEHISFTASYIIACTAVCIVILLYSRAIFKDKKPGIFITLTQAVSYCLLYGILQSEDYALLLGSVMIFAVIALLMYLTRKIDWYENRINLKQ